MEVDNQTTAAPPPTDVPPLTPSFSTTQLPTVPLDAINAALMDKCRIFVERLRDGAAPWIVQKLNDSYGNMPTDAPSFSFWIALVGFSVHPMVLSGVIMCFLLIGPSNRRIRESQAAANQKR